MATEQQVPPPAGARNGAVIDLNDEEYNKCEKQCKYIVGRIASTTLMHPISFARTLMQLGHEPYPIERGKAYFIGREANYLPNILKYLSNVYHSHGFGALYTGIGASVFDIIISQASSFAVSMYLDKCYPEVGGAQDLVVVGEEKQEEEELDAFQALRLKFRESIRKTIVQLSGLLISRPFTVIMVRQIAQHIGNETKYTFFNPIQPLMCIGAEEGPAGFYSGIIPASINVLVSVWGTAALSYGVDRALKYIEKEQDMQDEKAKDVIKSMRTGMDLVIMLGVNNIRYPFEVVSTVMAVTGSSLLVSLFPYSSMNLHWSDVYDCLKPFELYRGAKLFWREQKSPIRIGPDHKTYASKKHFI